MKKEKEYKRPCELSNSISHWKIKFQRIPRISHPHTNTMATAACVCVYVRDVMSTQIESFIIVVLVIVLVNPTIVLLLLKPTLPASLA